MHWNNGKSTCSFLCHLFQILSVKNLRTAVQYGCLVGFMQAICRALFRYPPSEQNLSGSETKRKNVKKRLFNLRVLNVLRLKSVENWGFFSFFFSSFSPLKCFQLSKNSDIQWQVDWSRVWTLVYKHYIMLFSLILRFKRNVVFHVVLGYSSHSSTVVCF